MKTKEHKHYWELADTQLQPNGYPTSTDMVEVAYLICHECGSVKKERIKNG